jgi:hypothetical protein
MSIIIPGSRFCSSVRAIERNGRPPYAKTTTERTGTIRLLPGNAGAVGWGVVVVSLVSVHFFGFSPGRAHLGISISP